MDDYLTSTMAYVVQLGFENARPFAAWKAYYPVQRMINKDYCWILAAPYRMEVHNPDATSVRSWADAYRYTFTRFAKEKVDPDSVSCGSEEMAKALGLAKAGAMLGDNTGGYVANLQPALAAAVDLAVPGAQQAWDKLQSRPFFTPATPQWSISPWPTN
jgi:hypothetical protein